MPLYVNILHQNFIWRCVLLSLIVSWASFKTQLNLEVKNSCYFFKSSKTKAMVLQANSLLLLPTLEGLGLSPEVLGADHPRIFSPHISPHLEQLWSSWTLNHFTKEDEDKWGYTAHTIGRCRHTDYKKQLGAHPSQNRLFSLIWMLCVHVRSLHSQHIFFYRQGSLKGLYDFPVSNLLLLNLWSPSHLSFCLFGLSIFVPFLLVHFQNFYALPCFGLHKILAAGPLLDIMFPLSLAELARDVFFLII